MRPHALSWAPVSRVDVEAGWPWGDSVVNGDTGAERPHRALNMDCPVPRLVQRLEVGSIREVPEVGGLHHHDERQAAWWHVPSSAGFWCR
jgi:hypothetical protein